MKINKLLSDRLEACYSVCRLQNQDYDFLLVASEVDQACFAYDLNSDLAKIVVWEDVGGTMSIIPIPGTMDFLATQKFYPGFKAKDCQVVYASFQGDHWDICNAFDFPYLHRFDLIKGKENQLYFIGCTIANSKAYTEDWSDKGRIFVARFNTQNHTLEGLQQLPQTLLKNHGYYAIQDEGYSLITSVEGVLKLTYPEFSTTGDWQLERLFDEETSDVVKVDINQDGKDEYVIIQGFHGDRLRIFTEDFGRELFHYPEKTPFGHAIWSGRLLNQTCFVFGWRSEKAELRLFHFVDGHLVSELVDAKAASSNVLAFEKDGKAYLFSANNGRGEVALYQLVK
ncbi:TPA: hypothetical protein U7P03_001214 [Streptococcus agalactiae]|uniref:hypothetical protein n=1 Tax=Streptococcus TaxID=1301 RepID=UPI00005C6A23|nr:MULTISPECIES: hypothetical protein [Streptococcus]AMD33023.1 hypothetical protein AMM49_08960 [Streptococcus agalactiae]AOF51755.1 hypothetical protein AMR84_09320 [Streptococcus agalactiae]ARC25539.1 hypothetical protein A6J68_10505 [Streptococcus sp. 'group B']ASA94948.1 hypothetical protein BB162_09045 [Streptococcus agalactiae]ASZ02076.1 hypothetical protein CHF17_01837 [Streptococcus agalactiae]